MLRIFLLIILTVELSFATINDDDLSAPTSFFQPNVSRNISPDRIESTDLAPNEVAIEMWVEKNGELTSPPPLKFRVSMEGTRHNLYSNGESIECEEGQTFSAQAKFDTTKFKIANGSRPYEITVQIQCGKKSKLIFEHDSVAGQVVGIWDICQSAVDRLRDLDLMGFWSRKVSLKWPARGSYYTWGTVYLANGHHWDVVAHELGHALYDQANIGAMPGGSHRIDGCYSEGLALSEGWASYFAAWLRIELSDPNAQFEYLVPRRAPIEIEHVPADVCRGPGNEWRVFSFLWDIIDTNNDGESIEMSFKDLWKFTKGKNFRGITELARALPQTDLSREDVDLLWSLNLMTSLGAPNKKH